MKHERRNTPGGRHGDYPLALGLIASALLHLLLVFLDPPIAEPRYGAGASAGTPSEPGAQFTVLSLSREGEAPIQVDALPPARTLPASPFTSGAGPAGVRASGEPGPAEGARELTVAERLRYHTRPFSPTVPMRETNSQRAIRESRERIARAGEELGPLPPNGVIQPQGGGIRIPFGFKPPGPAQTVPAPPLPDSILRRDSIRAAVRAAARRDSIRAARADTVKLRNVAPRPRPVIPRVKPDTTAIDRPA